jgi:predicted GH43/DUF377 family glycosyl hydrolase
MLLVETIPVIKLRDVISIVLLSLLLMFQAAIAFADPGSQIVLSDSQPKVYEDGRPTASYRLQATDSGIVLRHGDGPLNCDYLGARDVWVWDFHGVYYMNYDGAGPKGWLACLAASTDLIHWQKHGPVLDFGAAGSDDSASASYGTTYFDGHGWHMFYLGTPNTTSAPNFIPAFPYTTMAATGSSPSGPWIKEPNIVPFRPKAGTYYNVTASPGQIVKQGDEYLMFFSASMKRTIGIARTKNLDSPWIVDASPIVPSEEQVENTSLYFERKNRTWFLFTNHIGIQQGNEYTDSIWVYWSKDLNHWDAANKAVVLDGSNCAWSKTCIGLPSVVKVGNRLAILYDGPGGTSTSHMNRDVGLAWLNLPLLPPPSGK